MTNVHGSPLISEPHRMVATTGPVLIVGTGLLGTSVALVLRGGGVEVLLQDSSPTSEQLACDMGAGTPVADSPARPSLVVVATPPDVAGACVIDALDRYPEAIVTDVASVKEAVMEDVVNEAQRRKDPHFASRYVGSHPMAGRERSGASAADADLFIGRPWVIVPHAASRASATMAVRTLAVDVGSMPIEMTAGDHDRSVALVSHVPQLVSSLLAARLAKAPGQALNLAGQGLRDTTRIAASDPRLWTTILAGNAHPVVSILRSLQSDLQTLIDALGRAAIEGPLKGGSVGAISRVMTEGNRGVERIPGKHGGAPARYSEVEVLVPDEPGALGRLFSDMGDLGMNIEDLAVEHSSGQKMGLVRLQVEPGVALQAELGLEERQWRIIAHHSQGENLS